MCSAPDVVGDPCPERTYLITLEASGNGADCANQHGDTLPCSPGEGNCPADIDCQGTWQICQGPGPTGTCPDKEFIIAVPVSGEGAQCAEAMIDGVFTTTAECLPGDGFCTCPDGSLDC